MTAAPWVQNLRNVWSPIRRTSGTPTARRPLALNLGGNRTNQLAQMGNVGTLFSIVDRISSSQSQIDWCLYQRAASGRVEDRIEVVNHLALDLWRKPNDYHDGPTLIEMGQQHYELTGETWIVVDRDDSFRDIPLGLWTVRPDRIEPVPGTDRFIAGYVYTGYEGEQVPLELDEVICLKRPNPEDPYRGLGAVQAVSAELQTSRAVAEWNRNFFRNGALPAGVIEYPTSLDDDQWKESMDRWREAHQGVGRAHRVATLEHGAKFVQNSYSPDDLMVTDLRTMTRDAIMEAFGVSRHMLGITEDVNRANANAGEYIYAKYIDRPRAVRWRGVLNNFYLPLFGDARPLEFDFKNPVPEDEEAENAGRESRARATKDYVDAGFEPEDVLVTVGTPPMRHTGTVPNPGRTAQP